MRGPGKHRFFSTVLRPNLFSIVLLYKSGKHPISCEFAAAPAKKYVPCWLPVDADFHWFQQDFAQAEEWLGWLSLLPQCPVCGCFCNQIYSRSPSPFHSCLKMSLTRWGLQSKELDLVSNSDSVWSHITSRWPDLWRCSEQSDPTPSAIENKWGKWQ